MLIAALTRTMESPLSNPASWLYEAFGAAPSLSGESVNTKSALKYSPIWRGVNLISNTVAKTPIFLLERNGEEKTRARKDPRFQMLRYRPAEFYDDYRWKNTMVWRAVLRGNSFSYIMRNGPGQRDELVPLDPDTTFIVRENGQLWYVTKVGDKDVKILPEDMIHFRGWGDGLVGLSLVEHARECIGLGLAQQNHASVFYKNGMKPSVVLEYPKVLDDKQYSALLERYKQAHSGANNMERPLLLQGGMTTKPWVVTGRDAQFLEQRKFGVREAANFLCLPAYKLGDDARTSHSSLEQSNQEFVDESIDPWLVMIESELREKLLTEDEKDDDTHIIEFHRQALQRTNFVDAQNGFRTALGGRPWMVPDEVRTILNMPALPDGVGSEYLDPLNMGNLGGNPDEAPLPKPGAPLKPSKKPVVDDDTEDDERSIVLGALLADVVIRTATRIGQRLEKQAARKRGKDGWLLEFRGEHESNVNDELRIALAPYCLHRNMDVDGATARVCALLWASAETGSLSKDELLEAI